MALNRFQLTIAASLSFAPLLWMEKAAAEDEPSVFDKFTISGEVLGIFTEISPVENAANPNNLIEEIEDYDRSGDLRLRIQYRDVENGLKFRIEPWMQLESTGFSGGIGDIDRQIVIGRYLASWHDILPRTTLSAHRSVVAWGPGFLSSPSNPFPIPSSTENPLTEKAGLDFWHVSTAPTDSTNVVFYHNYGLGADDDSSIDPFQEAWSLNVSYMDFNYSGGLTISHQEDDGLMAGLFGQWTASESNVVWTDLAFRERGRAFYPHSNPASLVGGEFVNDSEYAPEILVGASHTTESDTSFYLEYLYNGAGYSDHELDIGQDIQQNSANIISTIPALGIGTLQTSAENVQDYRARHIIGMTVSRSFGPVDLQVQNAFTPQDWSGRLYGSATYSIDRFKFSLSAFQNYGAEATAFRQDIDNQVSLAILGRF